MRYVGYGAHLMYCTNASAACGIIRQTHPKLSHSITCRGLLSRKEYLSKREAERYVAKKEGCFSGAKVM